MEDVYKVWSYELTATLVPTPKRREKLRRIKDEAARQYVLLILLIHNNINHGY